MKAHGVRPGVVAILALVLSLFPGGGATAQSAVRDLADRCAAGGVAPTRCIELAVTARSLQGASGLLAGLGSEVAGSPSTLGRRLGTSPRIAVSTRAAFAPVALPDLQDPGSEPSREASFVVPAVHAGVALGVFDGFFLLPTVGGVLSLDLLGQTSVLFLPSGEGFDGRASAWSVGARLGILRESFTLPGVAVSLTRRDVAPLRFGDAQGPGGGSVEVDPVVTSVRATVGKDLLSLGVMAGMGWDWYSGSTTVRAPGGSADAWTDDDFAHARTLLFGGLSMNFLVLQLSGEVGWARGYGAVDPYRGAPFDPTSGTAYGSLALRLTL